MMLSALLLTPLFTWTVLFSPGTAVKVIPPCDQNNFYFDVQDCRSDFNSSMETSGYQEKCPWPDVKLLYNKLKTCVDESAKRSLCNGYMFMVDEVFFKVHQTYFPLCRHVHDPSLRTLIMLITPTVVITLFLPFLCAHLTTWKTRNL